MRTPRLALALPLVIAACGPRGGADDASADSTATVETVDSVAVADSTRADSASADSTRRPVAPAPGAAKAPIIGRDSAFGPRYLVDSTGKLIPVPTKKP